MRQLLRAVPWGAVLLYLGAALVVTYPLVFHLGDSVVGDFESDVWKHLWGFWWVKQCLVDQHVLPLYTALLNYPAGGSLFFIDPLGGLLSVPLQIFVAPHVAFNLLVLFNITLAGSGAFLLARYLTRSTPAAYVAGVIYGCSPYMLANVTSGISESYNIGWIPLFMLFFLRTLREAETSNAVWAGIFLATATVGCWYYGVFCAVFAALFFLCWSLEMWRAASRKAVDSGAAAQQVSGGNPRLYQLIIASLVLAYLYCSSWMRVYEPADAAFWDWLCGAAASLLALMLLVRMRRRAAKSEAEPPTGSGGAVFLLAYVLLMSAWMLLQMLPRALPLARLGDNLALLAMIVANGTALMISGRVLVNRLEGRAAEIGTLALRWTKLAIALAVTVDTVIAALSVRPAPAALESVQEQAGLAIQALVAVWL
ncbi:MAG: hypothetical protein FJX76_29020, partial [Armatimonadetes bacterium]|nr:hypothetical protein [Armatimonadota bacterium]